MASFPLARLARNRAIWLIACLSLVCTPARSQACTGSPGPTGIQSHGERFGMLAKQCPGLAGPLKPHRAAQLDLYDRPPAAIATGFDASAELPTQPGSASGAAGGIPAAAPRAGPSPAVPSSRLPPPGRDAARVISLAPAISATALEFGIDPLLLHAVAHVESRHDARAVSPAGARGLMQVMPTTARRFGVGNPQQALFDADVNLRASAAYLQLLRGRYHDDLRLTLAAYNAGEGAVATYGGVPPYAETQAYVQKVLTVYRRLGEAFEVSPAGRLIERGGRS